MRECGQEPLQFYRFRAAVRFYKALLPRNSDTLARVLKADIAMSAVNKKCWSAESSDALHGLERSSEFQLPTLRENKSFLELFIWRCKKYL